MREMPVTSIRDALAETIRRVEYHQERVLLTRHNKAVAALVSADDLALLEALEDRADIEAVREALAESRERIPYDALRTELGLD